MVRTQIYIDDEQKAALDRLSAEKETTVSGLIRQAVDQFLGKVTYDFEEALESSFGIWRHRHRIGESSEYVRKIRSEWDERDKRIQLNEAISH